MTSDQEMNTTLNIYLFILTLRCVKLMKFSWTGTSVYVIKGKSPPIKLMFTVGQMFMEKSEKLTFVELLCFLHLQWKWNALLLLRYESNRYEFQRVWETLRCATYDHKNEQLLNFHTITPQILTCIAPNRFQESKCKVF